VDVVEPSFRPPSIDRSTIAQTLAVWTRRPGKLPTTEGDLTPPQAGAAAKITRFRAPGVEVSTVANTLAEWFKNNNLEAQVVNEPDRVVVQGQSPRWQSLLGMATALTVVLRREGPDLTVEIGRSRWAGKTAVAGAGLLVLPPLLLTAGYGAVEQVRLSNRTLEVVKNVLTTAVGDDPVAAAGALGLDPEIIETGRTVEDYRVDTVELNNLKASSKLTRKVTINKEWTQSYVIDQEATEKSSRRGDLKLGGLADLGTSFEKEFAAKYSTTQTAKRSYTDEIVFEVPEHTRRRVFFDYKLVWQHGIIRYRGADGLPVEVPYRVAVDLTLDLAQEDEYA
jgi:hypothetical protein